MGALVPMAITTPVSASSSAPVKIIDSRESVAGGVGGAGSSRKRHAKKPKPTTPIVVIQTRSWL